MEGWKINHKILFFKKIIFLKKYFFKVLAPSTLSRPFTCFFLHYATKSGQIPASQTIESLKIKIQLTRFGRFYFTLTSAGGHIAPPTVFRVLRKSFIIQNVQRFSTFPNYFLRSF